ncbi:urea-proton symporter dur3-like [Plakobranchus ocellatus]|uniref:Urea-proton symporter dur3-like n=1 Tax=Plakobranchus ocellatus TaxID=259542 RepID=A0AAV3ZGQ6_9GAST|nr:urea-proton symporter dur3-like [Plakobranchus ocellatus]
MTVQAFPGVVLSIVWVKTTGIALIIGGFLGMATGICACLARASTLEGGLSNFLANTSEGYAVLAGSCVCFFVSLIVDVGVSFFTHDIKSSADRDAEWQKLRDIDNILSPWCDLYKDDFPHLSRNQRPTYEQLDACFRKAKLIGITGCIGCLLLFVIIIPGAMAALHVLTSDEFRAFLMCLQIWTLVMACLIVLLVPIEEAKNIIMQLRRKKTNIYSS